MPLNDVGDEAGGGGGLLISLMMTAEITAAAMPASHLPTTFSSI
jgi:hypothetical protein